MVSYLAWHVVMWRAEQFVSKMLANTVWRNRNILALGIDLNLKLEYLF